MAFPTIIGTPAESATTSVGTSHVVNLPSGAAGNLFLLFMGKGTTSATINALTGWTELVDENQASGAFCAWRLCDGTEGATTTFTSSASTKSATIVYEINGQSAFAPEISAVASASTDAPNPNTCTPTGGAKDYLWITWFVQGAAAEEADDDTWTNNAATNYGSLLQKTAGTVGVNISAAVATCHRTNNAASEDAAWPAASTDQTITWRSFTVAVHPIQLVSADTGAFTETGVAASTIADRLLAGGAVTGSYAQTGVAATLERGKLINVDPGAYTQTGVAASTVADRSLADGAAPGSYALGGVAATFSVGKFVNADPGAYSSTGVDATFEIGTSEISISADPGAFVETGISATVVAGRSLADGAVVGSYAETGVSATLERDRNLLGGAEPGAYTESGVAATFEAARVLPGGAEPGVYSVSGFDVTFGGSRSLDASTGSFALTGVAATFAPAPCPPGGQPQPYRGRTARYFYQGIA